MPLIERLALRQMLTLPYVLLVLALAGVIGALSYAAGRDAVDSLSEQLLTETVRRIGQSVDKHVSGSAAVLEAAFPQDVTAPERFDKDTLIPLRTRFWLATSVHRDPNNYAYYGDRHGRFFGLWRHSDAEAELRLRSVGEGPRHIYLFTGIQGKLSQPSVESRVFDPRERPWYKAGQTSQRSAWTSIYIDFKTNELVATRARRVNNAAGGFEGVVATDLSLRRVNTFLQELQLSPNGLALVVEANGDVIGSSRGPALRRNAHGLNTRVNAAQSEDSAVADTFAAVKQLMGQPARTPSDQARTSTFTDRNGELNQVAYAQLQDSSGLGWIVMVTMPRSDFLYRVIGNFYQTLILAALAAVVTAFTGYKVLNTVSRELRQIVQATREAGEGQLSTPLQTHRPDELGDLARAFVAMRRRLLTDHLTGLSNRDALMRRVEERIMQRRRMAEPAPFALLFIDLNRFKFINDHFGHDVGDKVLCELAHRLRAGRHAHDDVARFAGDEFVIVLDTVAHRKSAQLAREQLEARLKQPLSALASLKDRDPGAGAAIGLALYPHDGLDVDTLLKHADQDMYARKRRHANATALNTP